MGLRPSCAAGLHAFSLSLLSPCCPAPRKKLQRRDVPLLHPVLGLVLVFTPSSQMSHALPLQQNVRACGPAHSVLEFSWSAFTCSQP